MKKSLVLLVPIAFFLLPTYSFSSGYDMPELNELTGAPKTACEVILCLSTGSRPHECVSPISTFFSIKAKTFAKTLIKRRNFLKLCPSASEKGMPELIDVLVNGAENCTASKLNNDLYEEKKATFCTGGSRHEVCRTKYYFRINSKLPSYCSSYIAHEFTDVNIRFVGSTDWTLKSKQYDSYKNQKEQYKEPAGKWVSE